MKYLWAIFRMTILATVAGGIFGGLYYGLIFLLLLGFGSEFPAWQWFMLGFKYGGVAGVIIGMTICGFVGVVLAVALFWCNLPLSNEHASRLRMIGVCATGIAILVIHILYHIAEGPPNVHDVLVLYVPGAIALWVCVYIVHCFTRQLSHVD